MEKDFENPKEKTFDAEETRKNFILEAAKDVGFSDASISKIEGFDEKDLSAKWCNLAGELAEMNNEDVFKNFLIHLAENDDPDISQMPLYVPLEYVFPEIEERLLEKKNPFLHTQLAIRTRNPEIISKLYKKENDPEVLYFIASNHETDPKIIEGLYNRFRDGNDENSLKILQGIAKNSRTPENIFSKLLEDVINNKYDRKGEEIAECLAENFSVPELMLKKIAEHEWSYYSSSGFKARRTLDVKIEKAKREKGM